MSRGVSTIHHAACHILAVAGITLHHHGGRFKDGHGDFRHGELLVVGFLCGDHRSIGGQHEVNARIRHQIGLEPDSWSGFWGKI